MKKLIAVFTGMLILFQVNAQQNDFTKLVNPFIGTGGHGHTFPGASAPFGMVQLSPDTRMEGWDACGGYYYQDSVIYGFSHTHLSGTGIADYADILLMPTTGAYQWMPDDYQSLFSHKEEEATPGYYQVRLTKYDINVQLTSTERAGMHQYTFPASAKEGNVLLDLRHGEHDHVLNSWLRVVNDSTLVGLRESSGWAKDQILYFALQFSTAFEHHQFALDNKPVDNRDSLNGKNVKAYFTFNLKNHRKVLVRIALSAISAEGALNNLHTEMPDFNFDRIRQRAHDEWNSVLGKIEVKGGTENQRVMFYSALYHCYLSPNIYQDVDGKFRSTDLKVHQADHFTNYTVFSLWDTYRAFHPLMTILEPGLTNDWINTFLAEYKYGGMTPTWELSGNETFCMIGHHSVPVIVDAYRKGIRNYDAGYALLAMKDYDESDRYGLKSYREKGFLAGKDIWGSASRTLEYSYDDWCIATMAKILNRNTDYNKYIERAQYYKNIFDPSTGFFRGKKDSFWTVPFRPTDVNGFYTEANAWEYNFAAQQDVSGMIALQGGRRSFSARLNEFFNTSSILTGDVPPDISGMIGQYAHGNEPSHHIAYLFNYAGMQWRTAALVHQICTAQYHNDPDGESGNDDCGQMSAWLVMSAMGFYQVCPGRPEYALGTPMFEQIKIRQQNGRTFTLIAKNISDADFYIQSAKLNGQVYSKSYITHHDIVEGASLTLTMAAAPNKKFAARQADCPSSAITHHLIVPVPYVSSYRNNSILLGDAEPSAIIYYTTDGHVPDNLSKRYTVPIAVRQGIKLKIIAVHPGMTDSKVVTIVF